MHLHLIFDRGYAWNFGAWQHFTQAIKEYTKDSIEEESAG
jgi:hypothetical protein